MKTLLVCLLAVVGSLQYCSGQQVFNPPVRWQSGTAAPSSGACDAASEVGGIYLQTGDPASVRTQNFVCEQTGASSWAWMPFYGKVQNTAAATCSIGDLFFDANATAGSNLFGCTSANTWTLLSGASGDVVGPASATDSCAALYDGTTGKLLKDSVICYDVTKNGLTYLQGVTSGGLAFSVANIAGTATTLIWPTDSGAATSGSVLTLGAVATCPTLLPAAAPATCRFFTWTLGALVKFTTGTNVTVSGPTQMHNCTGTCTVTVPVPAAGLEYCARNGNNVSTVITFAAIGSSAMYENTASTAYGTAGTGTLVSGGAVGDKICIVGLDATHYQTWSYSGTWTVN